MQNSAATQENSRPVSLKANPSLTFRPSNRALGVYPEELETDVHTEICTQVFAAAVFLR